MTRSGIKTLSAITEGFYYLPAAKQFGLLFVVSLSFTLLCAASLWFESSDFSGATINEQHSVSQEQSPNDESTTSVDMLSKDSSFGESQFIETAHYWHALELDIARTVGGFNQIKTARVHLAVPKSSAFVSDTSIPTASVLVELKQSQSLNAMQVQAIKKLVASSVPHLSSDNVTVVDNFGHLLPYKNDTDLFEIRDNPEPVAAALDEQQHHFADVVLKSILVGSVVFLILVILRFVISLVNHSLHSDNARNIKSKTLVDRVSYNSQETNAAIGLNRLQTQGQWRKVNKMALDDPEHIAQVIKKWVGDD